MTALTASKLKTTPQITLAANSLQISKHPSQEKYGLRDIHLEVDLLLMIYDNIEVYPNTTYLMVYLDNKVGVFDFLLRMWLVPVQFTSIYCTESIRQFIVSDGQRRGSYDGTNGRLTWS